MFKQRMELLTERLKLVELSLDDLTDIHQLHSIPQALQLSHEQTSISHLTHII